MRVLELRGERDIQIKPSCILYEVRCLLFILKGVDRDVLLL